MYFVDGFEFFLWDVLDGTVWNDSHWEYLVSKGRQVFRKRVISGGSATNISEKNLVISARHFGGTQLVLETFGKIPNFQNSLFMRDLVWFK